MPEVYDVIASNIASFLRDPPDTDFQRGHLAAHLELARIVGLDKDDPTAIAAAQKLLSTETDDETV
jgi:hypothetical protein